MEYGDLENEKATVNRLWLFEIYRSFELNTARRFAIP
jgi:hypothetical protein